MSQDVEGTNTPLRAGDRSVLHTIRLRGAWSVTPNDTAFRHSRTFGWPTVLDPTERVWLVFNSPPGPAVIDLNGIPVGRTTAGQDVFAVDVSHLLRRRNELVIAASASSPPGEVVLEVCRAVPTTS